MAVVDIVVSVNVTLPTCVNVTLAIFVIRPLLSTVIFGILSAYSSSAEPYTPATTPVFASVRAILDTLPLPVTSPVTLTVVLDVTTR